MRFCSDCGAGVSLRIPQGDTLPRYVCDACGTVHYQNPKIVAGCIARWEGKVLLCRRAIEPRRGLWTLSAGFMENGETTQQAAARETWEEARARLSNMALYSLINLPHISQVYLMFRGEVENGVCSAGEESLEVGWFEEASIPWGELAFPVIRQALELYFEDHRRGEFPVRVGDIIRHPDDDRLEIRNYRAGSVTV